MKNDAPSQLLKQGRLWKWFSFNILIRSWHQCLVISLSAAIKRVPCHFYPSCNVTAGHSPFIVPGSFAGLHGCSLPLNVNDLLLVLQWANQSRLRGLLTLPVIMQFPLSCKEGFCEKMWSKHSSEHTSFSSSCDKIIVTEQSQILIEFINHYNILIIYLNFMGH